MEKKYAEIDRKADLLRDSINKTKSQVKSKEKIFDKISTRYNYQTINGIGSYVEQDKELKMKKMNISHHGEWTK